MALSDLQQRQLERAEQAYLREPDRDVMPDEVDAHCKKCVLCEEYPVDDMLYHKDGEWVCADCLLDCFDHRDVITGNFFERRKQ